MKDLAPYIGPLLALYFIFRRGGKPRRVKPNRLWIYPLGITVLALLTLTQGVRPDLIAYVYFAVAVAAGGALGWFTTQHVELTLDDATGTIMSKPTQFGTILTAAVFLLRFAVEFLINGGPGGGNGPPHIPAKIAQHAGTLLWLADAALLFVAARVMAQAGHMLIRIRPMIAQHKAAQLPPQ